MVALVKVSDPWPAPGEQLGEVGMEHTELVAHGSRSARWGEQLDVRNITREDGDQAGELSAEQVAGYIAKYATEATESFGSGRDRRISADDLEHLDRQGRRASGCLRPTRGRRPRW
jgi:hypothetical protein